MKKIVIISLLLLLLFGCDSTKKRLLDFNSNVSSIDCTITATNDNGLIHAELKISNLSKEVLYIAPNNLPENSELTKDLFLITSNGEQVEYLGKMIKRAPFEKAELIKVLPGESKLMIANLNKHYDFTKTKDCLITYHSLNIQPENGSSFPKVVKLKSNTTFLKTELNSHDDSDKNEFEHLYTELQLLKDMPENQIKSNPDYCTKSPYFEAIVKGGNTYLPYIAEKLKNRDWFMPYAMKDITKVDIYGYIVNVKKIKPDIRNSNEIDWWLMWWEDNKCKYTDFENIKLSNIMKLRSLNIKDTGDIKLVQNEDFNGIISVKDETSGKQVVGILGLLPKKTDDGKTLIVVLFENINDNLHELGRFYYFSTGMNMGLWYSDTNKYFLLGQVDSEASVYLQWNGNKYVEHIAVNDY